MLVLLAGCLAGEMAWRWNDADASASLVVCFLFSCSGYKVDFFYVQTFRHIYIARNSVFLVLPLVLHHFPSHWTLSPLPPFIITTQSVNVGPGLNQYHHAHPTIMALQAALGSMGSTLGTLRALEWVRVAGRRSKEIRDQVSEYHDEIARVAAAVREDGDMVNEARRVGLGYSRRRRRRSSLSSSSDEEPKEAKIEPESESLDHVDSELPLRNRAREGAVNVVNRYLVGVK